MHTPVLLLIGASPNIGAAVAKKFAVNGYGVALAARSLSTGIQANGYLHVKQISPTPKLSLRSFAQYEKPWYTEHRRI
jgi:NAD(P)-dependent dehydrogenase (short-subunit alcohol dehydrogenase family)